MSFISLQFTGYGYGKFDGSEVDLEVIIGVLILTET